MNSKPLWYINEKTLIAILKVIKNFNEDIKKEIVNKITIAKSEEDYYKYEVNHNNEIYKTMCLSDY